jgi:sarcosine oxidase, subunit beta
MARDSYQFFKRFEEEIPTSCGFHKTGLLVCGDAVTEKGLVANSQMLRGLGIVSQAIDTEEAKQIEPFLNVSIFSLIVYEPESGYADPSMTASAFSNRAKELGSKILTNTTVSSITKRGSSKGYEISTNNGVVYAKKVIVATGPWSKALFANIGIKIPLKPVRHPVGIFQRPEEYSGTRTLIFDFPREAYYKPEGNRFF